MADIKHIAFGSLYENGEFCKPRRMFTEGPIEFLNSTLGAIGWNRVNGIFYCRDVYCMGITWEELRSMGYVYGRPVRIDGVDYLCRCPRLSPGGEWEQVVQATEGQVEWDTKEGYQFFGQEYIPGDGVFQEVRCSVTGRYSLDMVSSERVDEKNLNVGFRPVLEPIEPGEHQLCPALLNKPISVYLGNACLRGTLLDYTDYDLSLEYDPATAPQQPDIGPAVMQKAKKAFIDRGAITFIWK